VKEGEKIFHANGNQKKMVELCFIRQNSLLVKTCAETKSVYIHKILLQESRRGGKEESKIV
jgi:hypothetical protein